MNDPLPGLLEALDAGERQALYPLADYFLERGDPLGDGVLWIIQEKRWPAGQAGGMVAWYDADAYPKSKPASCFISNEVFTHLSNDDLHAAVYGNIHVAIQDLAQAWRLARRVAGDSFGHPLIQWSSPPKTNHLH